ncbi:molybdate/tungstate transport system ATP-binding protein [Desulfobaculum xiamenense]|uniref:Molybdate/tungstate transport system ATP-binding protein n=1 Tax=Desulfobaculum xiamenense TaxID=995050 RepID=A0A846QJN6_9BACT|nr:ABC transporter ATP-binding protein [Desulfobaculum xiamenense]NJB66393.1 molybdate/tungstate transport system ATP-binding protein [Desulfobaculum xiamenense]
MIRMEHLDIVLPGFCVRDVNLDVADGEFFALIGPTGSGKSLVLESVAGLVPQARGRITVAGRDVTALPPERRGVGIVYQDNALFPHLSVMENITYGLRYHRLAGDEAARRVEWLVDVLGLSRIRERGVCNLSGGEQQRVSLARALAVNPPVLLLDEPLSALDPNFREEIRALLKTLHAELGTTFFMVTHDFAEALFLAERVGVLRDGALEQVGPVRDVFCRPRTPFVAEFVGMKNVFEAHFAPGEAVFHGLRCPLPHPVADGCGHVALRPEDLVLSRDGGIPDHYVRYEGNVRTVCDLGFVYEVAVRCGSADFRALMDRRSLMESDIRSGDAVSVGFSAGAVHAF